MGNDTLGGGSSRSIVEPDNMLHGALRRPDADASIVNLLDQHPTLVGRVPDI